MQTWKHALVALCAAGSLVAEAAPTQAPAPMPVHEMSRMAGLDPFGSSKDRDLVRTSFILVGKMMLSLSNQNFRRASATS
jgi:hypothetical protein